MAATVHLQYDSTLGYATATLSDATLTVTAQPHSKCKVTLIAVTCDKSNNKSQSYDSTSQVTLVSPGHYRCQDINVKVTFIPVPGLAYLEVYTAVGDGQGTTSPGYTKIGFMVGSEYEVTVRLSATPAAGYYFVNWTKEGGQVVSESAVVDLSIDVSSARYGDVLVRRYYANFAPQSYTYIPGFERHVSPDPVTHRQTGRMAVRESSTTSELVKTLYYNGTLYNPDGTVAYSGRNDIVNVRTITGKKTYLPGEQIYVRFKIVNRELWDFLGLQVLGWRITEGYGSYAGDSWVQPVEWADPATVVEDGRVTFTAVFVPPDPAYAGYYVDLIIGTDDVYRLEFVGKPGGAAELTVKQDVQGGPSVRHHDIGGKVEVFAAGGDLLVLGVGSISALPDGFVHGWSHDIPDSAAPDPGLVASKDFTMPDDDVQVTVYLCNHRLLYDVDSSQLLHGRSGQLLYDCSVPPGTTVYD